MALCPLAGVSTIVMANVSFLFCKGGLAKSLFRCLPFSFYFTHTVLAMASVSVSSCRREDCDC